MPAGQKILHHRSDVLETVVLINPSDEAVSTEVGIRLRGISGGPHTEEGTQLIRVTGAAGSRGTGERKALGSGCGSSQCWFSVSAPPQTALPNEDEVEEYSGTGIFPRG